MKAVNNMPSWRNWKTRKAQVLVSRNGCEGSNPFDGSMKFETAKELGQMCELKFPFAWVNNVLFNPYGILPTKKVDEEVAELIKEAKENRVPFAKCGHADITKGRDLCYACRKTV